MMYGINNLMRYYKIELIRIGISKILYLISFPFSDMKKSKVRPAIVMSNDGYNNKFKDFIAIPLSLNLNLRYYTIKITNKES